MPSTSTNHSKLVQAPILGLTSTNPNDWQQCHHGCGTVITKFPPSPFFFHQNPSVRHVAINTSSIVLRSRIDKLCRRKLSCDPPVCEILRKFGNSFVGLGDVWQTFNVAVNKLLSPLSSSVISGSHDPRTCRVPV